MARLVKIKRVKIIFDYKQKINDTDGSFDRRVEAVLRYFSLFRFAVINKDLSTKDYENLYYEEYIRKHYDDFEKYDVAFVMNGFHHSQKAQWELAYSRVHGKQIMFEMPKKKPHTLAVEEYLESKGEKSLEELSLKYKVSLSYLEKILPKEIIRIAKQKQRNYDTNNRIT